MTATTTVFCSDGVLSTAVGAQRRGAIPALGSGAQSEACAPRPLVSGERSPCRLDTQRNTRGRSAHCTAVCTVQSQGGARGTLVRPNRTRDRKRD
eukprot:6186535-Prymnesium_polylepis.1